MSLLMEALKKSERAKQKQDDQPCATLEMQPPPEQRPPCAEVKNESPPIINPDNTPKIPELTLMSNSAQDDLPLCAEPTCIPEIQTTTTAANDDLKIWVPLDYASSPEVNRLSQSTSQPASQPGHKPGIPDQNKAKIADARQKAKSVFAAQKPANRRTLLIASAVVALALMVVAFGIYFWQVISGTSTLQSNIPNPAVMQAAPPPPAATNISPPSNEEPPLDLPDLSPPKKSLVPDQAPTQAIPTATKRPPRETPAPTILSENKAIHIRQGKATNQLNPILDKAYKSFLAGDFAMAQQQYSQTLQQEPNNRDALLGLAATALNRKQPEQAMTYYIKLLELAPTDPDAFAGLIGLRGQTDPAQSESSLKRILAQNPQAAAIHFALGNVYTQQSRWAEAQQSYFRAYSNAPNNADYAFNLAISLDHLNQSKLALEYYQRALAQSGPASFDKAAAQKRAKELTPPAGE